MPPPPATPFNPGGLRPCTAMAFAIAEARHAAQNGEVPVGAIILDSNGTAIARASNRVETDHDPSAHAELLALRAAARARRTTRLSDCTLVVTLEPCPMCAAAAVHFRIRRILFGAYDPKGGGIDHGPRIFDQPACLHRPEVIGGIREQENAHLLKAFFRSLRKN
ncbi:tRNA-specific adenosine deaminase [Acetobacter oeni]|uniref:tRNA-specific adenosine deaminase n=2 Tax=Acetobacter oeni TaxID=304077 RepID=A0A511XH01_9PROT|nr:cytosine deaminase [Acetobacter oeni]GBR02343.1 cytosine deaminase [Acetobacter oeni LMG 21952]GEN62225.1 tRNA-specific adenosine deaminase [Acetobacter oeni]